METDTSFVHVEDVIEQFLESKLKAIKDRRQELEEQLQRRNKTLDDILQKGALENVGRYMAVGNAWKMMLDGKYALGFSVCNIGEEPLRNIEAILTWNTTQPLQYKVKIFEQYKQPLPIQMNKKHKSIVNKLSTRWSALTSETNAKQDHPDGEYLLSNEIKNSGVIVIVVDVPEFTERTSYDINGVFVYENPKFQQTSCPKVTVDVVDVTNDSLTVKKIDLIKGKLECVLTVLSIFDESRLCVNLSDVHGRSIDSILEIDCLFRRMEVVAKAHYYCAEDVGRNFEGIIVKVSDDERIESKKYFNIFSRSISQMLTLLHHLYRNIPGIVILPESSEEYFYLNYEASKTTTETFLKNDARKFGSHMEEEVQLAKKYCEELEKERNNEEASEFDCVNIENDQQVERYKKFRLKLAELENNTDLLFSKLKCYNNNSVKL